PRARRCGWRGGTALAWSPRRGRWYAAAWTSVRGWSAATSRGGRRCRRWPPGAVEAVRLLIFGGEACPPELATRLAVEGREVWNTYGPTEATVVACAARLDGGGPVRIGLPLAGWDLGPVDGDGEPVGD